MSLVSQLFRDHIRANKPDKMFPKKKLDAVNYFPVPAFDTNSPLHISSTNNSPSHRNQTNKKTTSNLSQNLNGQKCVTVSVFLGLENKFSYVRSTKFRESLISDLEGDASARSKIWSTWGEEGGRVSSKCFIFWSDQKFNGCRYIGRLSWKHLISILSQYWLHKCIVYYYTYYM